MNINNKKRHHLSVASKIRANINTHLKQKELRKKINQSIISMNTSNFSEFFYKHANEFISEFKNRCDIATSCKKNCDWCCYLQASATSAEIFYLSTYIRNTFSTLNILELIERSKAIALLSENKTANEHHGANIPCVLLKNGCCEAYKARPLACQLHHSVDEKICQRDFELPHTYYEQPTENPTLVSANSVLVSIFNLALKYRKLDTNRYELNQALLRALENPELEASWLNGNQVFSNNLRTNNYNNLVNTII